MKKRYSIPIGIFGTLFVFFFVVSFIGSTLQTADDSNNQVMISADSTETKKNSASQVTFYNPLYNCAIEFDGLTRISPTSHPELSPNDGIRLIEYQIKLLGKKIAFAESNCHERIDEWYFDSINIQQIPIESVPEIKEMFENFAINKQKEAYIDAQKQYNEYLEIYNMHKERQKQEIKEQLKKLED